MLELIEILTPLHQYCDGKTVFSIFDIFIQQDTLHGLCPSGKGIPSCTVTCHLVGSSQTWHWRVTAATHTELVWKCQKQSVFWLQPGWSVKFESGCSPRLLPEPPFCFISGLEALTKEFHTGCPWENLYEDDLDRGFMRFRGLVKTSVLCVPRALA